MNPDTILAKKDSELDSGCPCALNTGVLGHMPSPQLHHFPTKGVPKPRCIQKHLFRIQVLHTHHPLISIPYTTKPYIKIAKHLHDLYIYKSKSTYCICP